MHRDDKIARWVAGCGLALAVAAGAHAQAAKLDWTRFDWLIGAWTAEGGGAQQGTGGFTFAPDAGGQVLVRRNSAVYPAQGGKPASRHDDLMVIAPTPAGLAATYWDSEGHTIHYAVSQLDDGAIAFLSTDAQGPHFRLTYRRTSGGLDGRFEVAPPDQPTRFAPYLSWSARRTK